MMHNKTTTRRRALAPHHERTARLLFLALDSLRRAGRGSRLQVSAADLKVIRYNLTRLITLSGTRRAGDTHAQAFTRAMQGLYQLVERDWIDADMVFTIADKIEDRLEPYAPADETRDRRYDDTPRTPAQVVDLAQWRAAHPRN